MEEIKRHSFYFNKTAFIIGFGVFWDFSWQRISFWFGPFSYEFNWGVKAMEVVE